MCIRDRSDTCAPARAGAQVHVNYVSAMPRQYPAKAGVQGTAPEPVQGPRGEKRAMENIGSECNFDKQLAIICRGFLSLSRVSIGRFDAWSATSQLLIGIFLRLKIHISRPIFEGPSARNPDIKQAISATP